MIKKVVFAFFVLILSVSCSSDDDTNYHYELLPITEATVPDEFIFGDYYTISVKYIVPDDCYVHSRILYEYDFDARNVAVLSTVIEDKNCEVLDTEEFITFGVQALQREPYVFRFWQGEDQDGNPIYLEKIVQVLN